MELMANLSFRRSVLRRKVLCSNCIRIQRRANKLLRGRAHVGSREVCSSLKTTFAVSRVYNREQVVSRDATPVKSACAEPQHGPSGINRSDMRPGH